MNLKKILASSPWVELAIRTIYWRSNFINTILAPRAKKLQSTKNTITNKKIDFKKITEALIDLGVEKGKIVIIHSSGTALKATGLSPDQICDSLIEFIGPEGTLAMPAIPAYPEEPLGPSRLTDEICKKKLTYDVQLSPTWTGALPRSLMKHKNSIRSRHPLNSMTAVGRQAYSMMENNISGEEPLPCGINSSWKYCADNNASIVFLGVEAAHNLTMIHVVEDSWPEEWTIYDWYRRRTFKIKDGDFEKDITIRERRPHWAINYSERTLQKDLISNNILKITEVDGLHIEVCKSSELIKFLSKKKRSGYPYLIPFWIKRKNANKK